ncbi:hypothetical protein BC351_00760 [Paenibacillus ferrarius]|uniref:Accessory regulator AgrB n=1 Tax=Paenibacillus ferrarius TaxID=1469647 RepID=A0A1V4HS86_9BACL|nr:accessory gene regulator B family protein [Paenibacillus ferrarius]OPH61804.1 hypothetical protein BC351_00760 [Paenibacillus ferrarius]
MVLRLSNYIADYLVNNSIGQEHKHNTLVYGLQIIINLILVFTLILVSSIFLDLFKELMILFIFTALLRQMSGGLHLKSSGWCVILSTSLILVVPYLPNYIPDNYLRAADIVSFITILVYAPATFKVNTYKNRKAYFRMKMISLLMVVINIVLLKMEHLSIAMFIQSVSVVMEYYRLKKVGRPI